MQTITKFNNNNKNNKNNHKKQKYGKQNFRNQYRKAKNNKNIKFYDFTDLQQEYNKEFKDKIHIEVQEDNSPKHFIEYHTKNYLKFNLNKILNKHKRNLNIKELDYETINKNVQELSDMLIQSLNNILKNEETIKIQPYELLSIIDKIVSTSYADITLLITSQKQRLSLLYQYQKLNTQLKMYILYAIEIAQMKIENYYQDKNEDYHKQI